MQEAQEATARLRVYERRRELRHRDAGALVLVHVPTAGLCVAYDQDARTLTRELGLVVHRRSDSGGAKPDVVAVPLDEAIAPAAQRATRGYPVAEYEHVPGSEHLERVRLAVPDLLPLHGYHARARRNLDDVTLVHQGNGWAPGTRARVVNLEKGRAPASSLPYPADLDEPELISLLVDRGYAVSVWRYGSEWSRFGVRKGEVVPGRWAPRLTISDRLTREEAVSKEGKGRMQTQQPSMDEEVGLVRGRLEDRPRHKLELLVVKLGLMAEGEAKATEKGVLVDRLAETVRERRVPPEVLQAFLASASGSVSAPEVLRSATVDRLSPSPGCANDLARETGDGRHEAPEDYGGDERGPRQESA